MKFYETLPAITPRAARLKEAIWQIPKGDAGKLDMFTIPGYANATFMKRRAMQVQAMLGMLPVRILPGELVAGSMLHLVPALVAETYEERKAYAILSLPFPYRNMEYRGDTYLSENRVLSEEELHDEGRGRWSWGHSCFGLEKVLRLGYAGIRQEALDQLTAHAEADADQKDFWESVCMCCQAIMDYSARYADALDAMAAQEADPQRRSELLTMATCTRRVPAQPATTFREAVQSTWFAYMCHHLFNGTDIGRLDQYLYPFYARDEAAGHITPAQAQELLDCLWIKFHEWRVMVPDNRGLHPSIMLAGLKADGCDGTNPVTYMCLTATRHIAVPNPKVSIRINEQTPDELFELAHIMLSSGLMMPDFYNERAIISAYEKLGVPFEDAVCFAQSVCEEVSLAGISEECTNEGPHLDLHDMVMQAMRTCAPEEKPFDALLAQVEQNIVEKIASEVDFHHRQTALLQRYLPQPLHSATIEGCIASGRDIMMGGAKYNNTGSVLAGIATASNSLYAIKRLVYDEKRLSLADFLAILDQDWRGHELLRAEVLSKFPKYGNDQDDVDQYAVFMFGVFERELGRYRNSRGGVFKLGAWASEFRSNYPATPDGRQRWDSFAVNVSPTPGTDQKGATAVIRSATKLGLNRCTAGGMVDVTITPSCLKGPGGVQVLKHLVQTYCALGGAALQFNFVDSALLQKAMADPLSYKNLMVRVWGYNDYFVSLNEGMQKHILDRTRHEETL